MATRSKTYKSTDWKVWMYEAPEGVFTWDISEWDNGDVWASSAQVGGLVDQQLKISNISLSETSGFSQGSVFNNISAQCSISFEVSEIDKEVLKKYYTGRRLAITLDNPDTQLPHLDFGDFVTPMFYGTIGSISVDSEPFNVVHTITITAVSWIQPLMNIPMSVDRSTTGDINEIFAIEILNLKATGQIPANTSFGLNFTSVHFSSDGDLIKTLGEWADYCIASGPSYPFAQLQIDARTVSGVKYVTTNRRYSTYPIVVALTDEVTIPEKFIYNAHLEIAGNDVMNAVLLTSENTANYRVGNPAGSSLSNYSTYQAQIDVLDSSELKMIADAHLQYAPDFYPTSIEIQQAVNNQEIIFREDISGHPAPYFYGFFYPETNFQIGDKVNPDLSRFGFTDATALVIGVTHEITPDNWKTTYDLWKGIN